MIQGEFINFWCFREETKKHQTSQKGTRKSMHTTYICDGPNRPTFPGVPKQDMRRAKPDFTLASGMAEMSFWYVANDMLVFEMRSLAYAETLSL